MKNFLKNVTKPLAVSALIIAFYTPQTSCMKEKIKNAKAKIQHDLDSIENRFKHVIPTLANSKLWTKLCTYACITAARLIQGVGQPKPLKVSLLEKDAKEDQLYLAKHNKHQSEEVIVSSSSSKLKYFIVPLIILFIQPPTVVAQEQAQPPFDPFTPPIYPICHPQTDGTELCCQYQFNSLAVTCFIQDQATGQELAHGSVDPLEWKIANNYELSSQNGVIESEGHCSLSNQTIFQEFPENIDQHLSFMMNEPSYQAFTQYTEKLVKKTCGSNFTIEIDKFKKKTFAAIPKTALEADPPETFYLHIKSPTDFTNYAINIPTIKEIIHFTTKDLQAVIGHEIGHVLSGIYDNDWYIFSLIDRNLLQTNKYLLQQVFDRENIESTADTVSALITSSPLSLASFLTKIAPPAYSFCPDTIWSNAWRKAYVEYRKSLKRNEHPNITCRIVHMIALHEALPHLISQLKEQAKRKH